MLPVKKGEKEAKIARNLLSWKCCSCCYLTFLTFRNLREYAIDLFVMNKGWGYNVEFEMEPQ